MHLMIEYELRNAVLCILFVYNAARVAYIPCFERKPLLVVTDILKRSSFQRSVTFQI
jgi:hypothetical protein